MLAAALGVRFLLELAMLASLAWWGAATPQATWARIVLAVVAPLAAAAVWGALVSPKPWLRAPPGVRLAAEVAVFAAAALALAAIGHDVLAAALVAVWAADRIALALASR